jgi:hypothetical protein
MHDSCINSIKDSIVTLENNEFVQNYMYDSLSLYTIISLEGFYIANLDTVKTSDFRNYSFQTNYNSKRSQYVNNDSASINKIFHESTISFILASGESFFKQCETGGDQSCQVEDAFPEAKEIRIVFGKNDFITLTLNNFKQVMEKDKFFGQANSYIYTIE